MLLAPGCRCCPRVRAQQRQVLALDGNRIASLPDWIGELSRLESLFVGGNQLAALPPSLGRLQRLRQLLAPRNRLRALPPELGECSALEELDVSHNAIQAGGPLCHARCHAVALCLFSLRPPALPRWVAGQG